MRIFRRNRMNRNRSVRLTSLVSSKKIIWSVLSHIPRKAKFWECVRSRVRLNEEWSTRNIRGFRSGRMEMTLSSLRAGLPDA